MKVSMPIEQSGVAFAGYKLLSAIVAFMAPILAFFLMLGVVPLDAKDPHRDVVRRLLGCVTTSFVLGAASLIWIYRVAPWVFDSAWGIGAKFGAGPLGLIWLVGSVLLVCGLPGWVLVGAAMRSLAKLEGKDLPGMALAVKQGVAEITGRKE